MATIIRENFGGGTVGTWEADSNSLTNIEGVGASSGTPTNSGAIPNCPPDDVLHTCKYGGGGGSDGSTTIRATTYLRGGFAPGAAVKLRVFQFVDVQNWQMRLRCAVSGNLSADSQYLGGSNLVNVVALDCVANANGEIEWYITNVANDFGRWNISAAEMVESDSTVILLTTQVLNAVSVRLDWAFDVAAEILVDESAALTDEAGTALVVSQDIEYVGFQISRATNADFTQNLTTINRHTTSLTYTDANLQPGNYYYRVRREISPGTYSDKWSDAVAVSTVPPTASFSIPATLEASDTLIINNSALNAKSYEYRVTGILRYAGASGNPDLTKFLVMGANVIEQKAINNMGSNIATHSVTVTKKYINVGDVLIKVLSDKSNNLILKARIRAVDDEGNFSEWSDEIEATL